MDSLAEDILLAGTHMPYFVVGTHYKAIAGMEQADNTLLAAHSIEEDKADKLVVAVADAAGNYMEMKLAECFDLQLDVEYFDV